MVRVLALALVAVAACSSSADSADAAPPDASPVNPGDFQLTWGPLSIPAMTEDTRCITKRLDNPTAIHVGGIHNVLGSASHHLIVYRLTDGAENADPIPCTPFLDTLDPTKGAPLMITQKPDETLALPDGVAFTLAPHQLIRLELHFLNATPDPLMVQATTTFLGLPDSKFHDEADFLFVGNPDISIPAMSQMTLGPSYLPVPAELNGANIFAVTGHEHKWGTGVDVAIAPSKDGHDTSIYHVEPFNWAEPKTVRLDPAVVMPDAGGFRFTCRWNNQSSQAVGFGESTQDEMCFFWAYYYPSNGARVCIHSDQYSADMCCPGNTLCQALLSLLHH